MTLTALMRVASRDATRTKKRSHEAETFRNQNAKSKRTPFVSARVIRAQLPPLRHGIFFLGIVFWRIPPRAGPYISSPLRRGQ